jgi:two-component system LytT family response regulator
MEKKLRVLVVDDDASGRKKLLHFLKGRPDVATVESCASGPEAIATIARFSPDIMFLDVEMPDLDGFEVLSALPPERVPRVVFVTAYSEHAARAFEVGAIDYVLKPVDYRRFEQAFARVRADVARDDREYGETLLADLARASQHNDSAAAPPSARPLDRIMVKEGGRVFFVRVNEIDWVEAADNYIRLHLGRTEHLVRQTIRSLEGMLDLSQFARIHRSTLVNLDRILEIRQGISRDYVVVLKDGTELRLSDRYRRQLEERSRPHTERRA